MNLVNILIGISSILLVAGILPYLIGVIKGTTKPKIVTWVIWSSLTGIACAAALSEKQYPTAILLLLSSLGTLLVAIFGWKNGDKKIERLDIICLAGAIIGLILWQVFNSPAIAVLATISIDLVGGVPTLVHSWKRPDEEAWLTFFLSFLGSLCTLLVISNWAITAFAYPLYLVLINILYTLVIVSRRLVLKQKLL
jgi:hypothetical protein